MKTLQKLLLSNFITFLTLAVYAQPANDNCVDAIQLIPDSAINFSSYVYDGATRDVNVGMGNPTMEEVWFKFTATDYLHNVIVSAVNSSNWMNVGMAILEGDCTNGFSSLAAVNLYGGENSDQGVCRSQQFTPGNEYYIYLSNVSGSNLGEYDIMVTRQMQTGEFCESAVSVTEGIAYSGSNYFSSQDGEDMFVNPDDICAITLENGFWYKYTAPITGDYNITFDNVWYYGGPGSNVGLGHQIGVLEASSACSITQSIACDSSENYYADFTLTLTEGQLYYIVVEGDAGSLVSYDMTISAPPGGNNGGVGIEEIATSQIEVYPNPANDFVTISAEEPMQLSIYNAVGAEVQQINMQSTKEYLDLTSFENGIYFIQAQSESQYFKKRLIVRK